MNSLSRLISHRSLTAQSFVSRLQSTTNSSTSSPPSSDIKIPFRKERGPTDILRALERTINRDPTAPLYMFHDDPYLIPYSNNRKRTYALSQDAGRKAAIWIRQEHAKLFGHRVADPIIEKFLPKVVYKRKNQVSEDILKKAINDAQVEDALLIYNLLDQEVSIQAKQSLLELLCYYNNSDPADEDSVIEKWFAKNPDKARWKNSPEINKLFEFLKTQDVETATKAYNTMICAMVKFLNFSSVESLYQEILEKNIPIYLTTYNHLIKAIPALHPKANYTEELKRILAKIEESGLKPDIDTFNSALKVLSSLNSVPEVMKLCCDLFAEFKAAGVKPSLGTYYNVMIIFHHRNMNKNTMLSNILQEIEGREFSIRHPDDMRFFVTAMNIAANNLENPKIGDEIHKLLLTGNNYDFLENNYNTFSYYGNYLMLHLRNTTIDEFFKSYYDMIVPHVYIPEPKVMDAILDAIAVNDSKASTKVLSYLWSDIVNFEMMSKKNLVAKTLNLMRVHCKPIQNPSADKIFSDFAWSVWNYIENAQMRRNEVINWSGVILGDIAVLLLRANEMDKCSQIISYFYNKQNSIIEVPEIQILEELLEGVILNGCTEAALDLVNYCSDMNIEQSSSMVYKVWCNLPLNERQEGRLRSFSSPEVLKDYSNSIQ